MLLICSDQERLLLRVTPRNLRDVTMGIEDPFKLRRKVGVWRLREKVIALVFVTLSLREFALAQLSTLTSNINIVIIYNYIAIELLL